MKEEKSKKQNGKEKEKRKNRKEKEELLNSIEGLFFLCWSPCVSFVLLFLSVNSNDLVVLFLSGLPRESRECCDESLECWESSRSEKEN